MTIELTVLLSVVSVSAAVCFGLRNARRVERGDDRKEAADMTTVIVKLENIGGDVLEIKGEMRAVREDMQQVRERLVKVEESTKAAHKRMDLLHAGRAEE